ncbi:hypothetical protein GGI35DRAFT_462925 [Trichoderma velutinum]
MFILYIYFTSSISVISIADSTPVTTTHHQNLHRGNQLRGARLKFASKWILGILMFLIPYIDPYVFVSRFPSRHTWMRYGV